MMEFVLPRVLHILGIVLWIGGVAMDHRIAASSGAPENTG